MVIRNQCEPEAHEFEWFTEMQGVASWVCRKCGEWREQYHDAGSGG